MAVKRGYERQSMDELGEAALAVLRKWPGLGCGTLGDQVFGEVAHINGTAPYARIMGKVMRRLERDGKAQQRSRGGFVRWYATGGER